MSGDQVTVNTGHLEITSPQDSSTYKSKTTSAGVNFKVPMAPGANASVGGSFQQQKIKDNYKTTGEKLSGIYAGQDGVDLTVSGDTHLVAGVIDSKADASKNHFTTGKLIAESEGNVSQWKATSKGGSLNIGTGMMGNIKGALGALGSNMMGNSGLLTGAERKHDETSLSHSAISGNIHVNAINGTQGSYLTDTSKANGHLENKFDAQKLSNQLQNSQVGMQLVGEVLGQVSDQLHESGVWGFNENSVLGNIGCDALEGGGAAIIAAATGGNAGAAAASAVGANVAMGMMGNVVAAGAIAIAGKDDKLAAGLVDVGQNIIATAAGAGIGSAFGGSASMNGAQIGSSLQQYNWGGSSAATATALNNARPILAAIAAGGTLAEIGAVVAGVVLAPEVAAVGAAGAVGAAVIASIIYAENKKDDSTAHNATNTANDNASQNADKANQNNQQSGTISNGGAVPPDNQPPEDPKDDKNNSQQNSAEQGSDTANNPHQVQNEGNKSFDDLLNNAEPGDTTKGRTKQFVKQGGFDQAQKDFESLGLKENTIETINTDKGTVIKGQDADGNQINVRTNSLDGRATLEKIVGKNRWKIRYDP